MYNAQSSGKTAVQRSAIAVLEEPKSSKGTVAADANWRKQTKSKTLFPDGQT